MRHLGLGKEPEPEIYLPLRQFPFPAPAIALVIHTDADPAQAGAAVRTAIAHADPAIVTGDVQTIDHVVGESIAPERFSTALATAFGAIALLLAASGLYSVVAYLVSRQTQEIGIRMALGAQRHDIVVHFLGSAASLAACGVVLGFIGASATMRLLSAYLFGVSRSDPALYAAAAAVLMISALTASYLPSRRASKVDPAIALRYE